MEIIFLRGISNTGKTTSLIMLYNALKGYATAEYSLRKTLCKDILVVLEINGYKIGISSGGDTPSIVDDRVNRLIKEKCDVIFSAARTKKSKVEILIQNFMKTHTVMCIDKNLPDDKTLDKLLNILKSGKYI